MQNIQRNNSYFKPIEVKFHVTRMATGEVHLIYLTETSRLLASDSIQFFTLQTFLTVLQSNNEN